MTSSVLQYGSDLIVELMADAGIEYAAFNPGASFRGLHDSLVQSPWLVKAVGEGSRSAHGPQIIPCLHEAVSVAAAQGYAKATGRIMAVLLHNVVGLQNASMAIYNAWCDRAPMLLVGGTGPLSKAHRRPWIDWIHTASTQAEVVRDYVKWDDQPHDLASVPESFARAFHTALSQPSGPVYLCFDVDLQEQELPEEMGSTPFGAYPTPTPPALDQAEVAWLAGVLVEARFPVLVAGYSGETEAGYHDLVRLADSLGAAVIDTASRCNMPSDHDLNATGVPGILDEADVVVLLDLDDPLGVLHGEQRRHRSDATVVNISLSHLRMRGWSHDYQAFAPVDRHLTASAARAVGQLASSLESSQRDTDQGEVLRRRRRIAERTNQARRRWRTAAATSVADGSVPLERLVGEVGQALGASPFVLANGTNQRLEHRLWDLRQPRQHCGWHAGGGLGYGLSSAIGVALGAGDGAITVNLQADGDALYVPGALWTMAHLSLPVLTVVHNNRQYRNSAEHAHRIAAARQRPLDHIDMGTSLAHPAVDLAKLAEAFGVWGAGPVRGADELAQVLAEAIAVTRSGRPALVDVLTPPYEG